ncbi:hypothetical protein F4677DRAFT_465315 [Hypoxylon crocopeplum]|nr:hypothetical protein F4677DRAFT_465315 [Hypoxylon crocopeplum]
MSHSPSDEALLRPPSSWPTSPFNQRSSGSRPSSRSREAEDSTAVIANLNRQLKGKNEEIEKPKREADSHYKSADKFMKDSFQKIADLKHSLQATEAEKKDESKRRRQVSQKADILFNELCQKRADPKCEVKSHQEAADALEESVKATVEAIQNEEERGHKVRTLREELRIAHNTLAEERSVSRLVSQQVEYMENMIKMQHDESKEQKGEIDDLKQTDQILRDEIERLLTPEFPTRMDYTDRATGCEITDPMIERIKQLEKTMSEATEKSRSFQAQLKIVRNTASSLTRRVIGLERQDGAPMIAMTTKRKELKKKVLAAAQAELDKQLQRQASDEDESQGPAVLQLRKRSSPSSISGAKPTNKYIPQPGPRIMVSRQLPAAAPGPLSLLDQIAQLQIKNQELEDELQHMRQVNAELSGCYPLERVKARSETAPPWSPERRPPTPAAKKPGLLLNVPARDEEIPELRLPSPVASPRQRGRSLSLEQYKNDWQDEPTADSSSEFAFGGGMQRTFQRTRMYDADGDYDDEPIEYEKATSVCCVYGGSDDED